jgi:conjugative relaxase-like TrwC/TraI family protein
VLSIGKIELKGEGYYLAAVADGVDEYYRGVGEAPGHWTGTAIDQLGLHGDVTAEDLHAIWSGLDPSTGEQLGRFGGRRIAGFDLTFRAPKSVSLLAALADPATAVAVRDAHEAAVDAAFSYVEREAARSRTGAQGAQQTEVKGLLAAGFRHRTSRAGDPHLHTHMLVANMAEGIDGRWRTLDGRLLYLHAKTAGYLYEAHLRHELTIRLGVEWRPVRNGIADVVGIDQRVLDHFSDRSRQIAEHLDQTGFRSARAAELAALETRQAKNTTLDARSMRDVWRGKAAEIGFDPAELAQVLDRVPRSVPDSVPDRVPGSGPVPDLVPDSVPEGDVEAMFTEIAGPTGLTAKSSSFDRRDVLRAIAERAGAGMTVSEIEALADRFLEHPGVVRLIPSNGPGLLGSDVIRRADGTVIAAGVEQARWSTIELISLERGIVDGARARAGEQTAVVSPEILSDVLARRPTLADEQVEMVRRLVTGGQGLDVVSAAAGTGKTYTLDAAREAWRRAGYTVIGAAVAGIAAQELDSSANIPSSTIARLTLDLAAGRVALNRRTVVVIDEAGMAGTRTLAPVLDAAAQAGAKVVLVGDPRQLPEIDAGGVLAGLAWRLGATELVGNRRQREVWERDALAELRDGDVDSAFGTYQRNGRVVTGTTALEVRQRLVADWWSYRLSGDAVAMVAFRRNDVDDLNGRARAYLQRSGDLTGPELVVADRPFQAGDNIVCLRNDRRIGVHNGTRAAVTDIDPERHEMTIQTGGEVIRLPAEYLQAGHIAHGYATTIHKTQGATVDRGLLLGSDELFRERGYVGMSRGRLSNHLYLIDAPEPDHGTGHGPPPPAADPVDSVRAALNHRSEQRLAIDTGDPVALWPIQHLVDEKHRLHRVLKACPPDRTHDLASLSQRRAQLAADLEPLVGRHNELAARKLRGPTARQELRDLRGTIAERSAALDRIDTELDQVREAVSARSRFQNDHTPDSALLTAVEHEIDRHIARRVEAWTSAPSDHHLAVLGPLRSDPAGRAAWIRGAAILEAHHLGADDDPSNPRRQTLLGTAKDLARMRAQLEILGVPQVTDTLGRQVERDLGRDLFE